MFSQFFGNYLVENQKITAEQFSSCMNYIKANRVKLGLIAENEGLLTRAQANELNYMQMQSDKRFGDLAVEKGYLSEADVTYLLGRQGSPYLIFIQALTENKFLSRDDVDKALADFKETNEYSDTTFNAIKEGDIESILPAFITKENEKYIPLIGLTLRNIVRFVSPYIRIEKGAHISSLPAPYLAYQQTEGDYDGFLGFVSSGNGILAIASGYAKEDFTTVDEDALDSVCEFTNCVNGLYATELSYKDISIDMLPPKFRFDTKLEDAHGFYTLPIFVDDNECNLVVKLD